MKIPLRKQQRLIPVLMEAVYVCVDVRVYVSLNVYSSTYIRTILIVLDVLYDGYFN